jgi:hypothetical protein
VAIVACLLTSHEPDQEGSNLISCSRAEEVSNIASVKASTIGLIKETCHELACTELETNEVRATHEPRKSDRHLGAELDDAIGGYRKEVGRVRRLS